MVSNNYKLVLIVLCFFLALTFVRATFVEVATHDLVLADGFPTAYPLVITNTANHPEHYSIEAWGPFTIEVSGGDDATTIPANAYKTVTLFASPKDGLEVGESYDGIVRVKSGTDSQDVEVSITKQNAPVANPGQSGNGTGLISFPSVSEGVVNVILIIAVIILLVALLARIKNRVVG